MAIALINQLSGEFDITHFKDTYSADLLKLIKDKAKGKKIQTPTLRVVHSRSKDIMDQLKASLGEKGEKKEKRRSPQSFIRSVTCHWIVGKISVN